MEHMLCFWDTLGLVSTQSEHEKGLHFRIWHGLHFQVLTAGHSTNGCRLQHYISSYGKRIGTICSFSSDLCHFFFTNYVSEESCLCRRQTISLRCACVKNKLIQNKNVESVCPSTHPAKFLVKPEWQEYALACLWGSVLQVKSEGLRMLTLLLTYLLWASGLWFPREPLRIWLDELCIVERRGLTCLLFFS